MVVVKAHRLKLKRPDGALDAANLPIRYPLIRRLQRETFDEIGLLLLFPLWYTLDLYPSTYEVLW